MTAQRLFIIIGLCAAMLFTFATPPFQVPDEVGHFWRAVTIARGAILPRIERAGGVAQLEQGLSTIVFVFWVAPPTPNYKVTWPRFRTSWYVRLEPEHRATVTFPAGYTPVAYLPQIAAALLTRIIPARPVITFYLGRLFNALAYIALVAFAIRITPVLQWLFAAAALLPMALFLAASWSPDAMTIAASFVFTAALLRAPRTPREVALTAALGACVGLCKPGYVLIALLAFAVATMRGAARAIIIAATAAGFALAMWNASRSYAPVRPDAHVDPPAQIDCLRNNPARFAEALAHELRVNGVDYTRQMVGRLGMLDVPLPGPVIWAEALVLLACAWTSSVSVRVRAVAAMISIATIGGIALASYIGWTPPCATNIDGLQGRYLLPIAPVMFSIIAAPLIRRERIALIALAAVAAICNAVALYSVAARYYS
ncbi:MAG TPA: DUF2142 domain-containing protein [Thermoanaerobaculia bacterium]